MATNNFKAFALDPNANVTSQAEWEALPALLSGFTAGKASSAQVNKAIRQASFIAAALAQYTTNKSGLDVLDDGDLNGFITKMSAAFGKDFQALDATLTALAGLATGANKLPYFTETDTAAQTDLTSVGRDIIGKNTIADILTYLGLTTALNGKQPLDATLTALAGLTNGANKLPYFNGTDSMAVADLSAFIRTMLGKNDAASVMSYLGLGSAAQRYVGIGTDQIPDMSAYPHGSNWFKFPSGLIIQILYAELPANTSTGAAALPTVFPSRTLGAVATGGSLTGYSLDCGTLTLNLADNYRIPWRRFNSTEATGITIVAFGY